MTMTAFKSEARTGKLVEVSAQNALPVDDKGSSSAVATQPNETVSLYYSNSGVLTVDAGQAAGVMVAGKLAYDNIKDQLGATEGSFGSSSLSFTSTALTTEVTPDGLNFDWTLPINGLLTDLLNKLSAGQYVVLYGRGLIVGKKADASTTLTATSYKYNVSGNGNTATIAGQTIKQGVTNASSVVTGEQNILPEAIYRTTPLSKIDGQVSPIESDSAGNKKITQATWERGADLSFDLIKVQNRATKSVPITASALVFTGAGQLMGWVVNSCSAGATVKVWDNTSAATTVAFDTMTYTAAVNQGPAVVPLKDVQFTTGCYFTLSGTISLTPLFNQL